MSWRPTLEPLVEEFRKNAVTAVIEARERTIVNTVIRRLLPSSKSRTVGPFVYFDHMGPEPYDPARGDMPQHPHINLATVTYLFDGELTHRDSTGAKHAIRPGDVNWMTAGRGVVHSERVEKGQMTAGARMHGIQVWVALPRDAEEQAPSFHHYPKESFPNVTGNGSVVRVLVGRFGDAESPVKPHSPTLYCDVELSPGGVLDIPSDYSERALYVAQGEVEIQGETAKAGRMVVFAKGKCPLVRSVQPSRAVLIGGEPLEGPRFIWWNFVSSRADRIEEAARDWQERSFKMVPDDVPDSLTMPPMKFPWRIPKAT